MRISTNELELAYQTSSTHIHRLLNNAGYQPVLSVPVLQAALELLEPPDRTLLVHTIRGFFSTAAAMIPHGLDTLPAAWLLQIPGVLWRSLQPHWTSVPYMIRSLTVDDGVLCVSFAQELPNYEDRITAWDKLRIFLNFELRANLWRPLPKPLEHRLWQARPDLRSELFRVL